MKTGKILNDEGTFLMKYDLHDDGNEFRLVTKHPDGVVQTWWSKGEPQNWLTTRDRLITYIVPSVEQAKELIRNAYGSDVVFEEEEIKLEEPMPTFGVRKEDIYWDE